MGLFSRVKGKERPTHRFVVTRCFIISGKVCCCSHAVILAFKSLRVSEVSEGEGLARVFFSLSTSNANARNGTTSVALCCRRGCCRSCVMEGGNRSQRETQGSLFSKKR